MGNPRIAHGFAQEIRTSREISEGVNPRVECRVAPYLPVKYEKYQGGEKSPVVILKGQLLALDQWNQIVPANNGIASANNLVYTSLDVTYGTYLYDGANNKGKGAVATVAVNKTMPANNLIGYSLEDIYADEQHLNYKIQTDIKGFGTERLIEYPIRNATQADCSQGQIVTPDEDNIGEWRPLVAADLGNAAGILNAMNNRFGKIIKIFKITSSLDKLDVMVGAPGYNLHATKDAPGGAGIPNHLALAAEVTRSADDETGGTSNSTAYQYRVQILVRV